VALGTAIKSDVYFRPRFASTLTGADYFRLPAQLLTRLVVPRFFSTDKLV
jgi:hypothetical protein